MEDNKKRILNRISKATGHLESVRKMVERDEDPVEILTQLAAVKAALGSTSKALLKDYVSECALKGDEESLKKLTDAIDSFIKNS